MPTYEGPPKEVCPGTKSGATTNATTTTEVGTRDHSRAVPAQLLRRRIAAWRCEPLASGHRDPWQPWRSDTLSDHAVDGWRDAAVTVLATGATPIVPLPVLRALWRRNGSDRALAQQVWELAG